MNHSDDHPPHGRTAQAHDGCESGEMHLNTPSCDEGDASVLRLDSFRSLDSLFDYEGFSGIRSQQVMPWIDPYDFGGGEVVRAVCSNAAPSTMVAGAVSAAKSVALTCDMLSRDRIKRAGNPKVASKKTVSTTRSLRRLLRHKRKVK